MNKEKLLELSDTLRGIAEGANVASFEQWHEDGWVNCKFRYRNEQQPPPPDPYTELKEAHAAGKTIQFRPHETWAWGDRENLDWTAPVSCYRIKPEPRKVPLGPEDVPPGSAVRSNLWCDPEWRFIAHVYLDGVLLSNCESTQSWDNLETYYLINRSIPLTGKWDKDAWQPCYKLIEE